MIDHPSTLTNIAFKDVARIAKVLGVDSGPKNGGILSPATVLSISICVKQGFPYFKQAYKAAEEKLKQWCETHSCEGLFLRLKMDCDAYWDTIALQLCEYPNKKHEQKAILQDTGLRERQTKPNQVQLPGGESDFGVRTVCDYNLAGRDEVRPVHHSGVVKPIVYLAGPITGCSYEGCTDWRNVVQQKLSPYGVEGLSPMRAKEYLKAEKSITGSYEDKVMSCARGITTRDRFDCMRCAVLMVNFLGAKKVSIGTVMEIAWADSQRIPIICVIEDTDNVHDHPMIRECIGFRVATLDEAVEVAIKVLGTL